MAYKFYKNENIGCWIYQNNPNSNDEITVPIGYHRRDIENEKISITGVNTHQNDILKRIPVTIIDKNANGDKYSNIDEFIDLTNEFFSSSSTISPLQVSRGQVTLSDIDWENLILQDGWATLKIYLGTYAQQMAYIMNHQTQ